MGDGSALRLWWLVTATTVEHSNSVEPGGSRQISKIVVFLLDALNTGLALAACVAIVYKVIVGAAQSVIIITFYIRV